MKKFKRIIALVLAAMMAFSVAGCSSDEGVKDDGTHTELVAAINGAGKYLVKKVTGPTYGDETVIIALNRSTYIDYWHNRSIVYDDKIDHIVKSNGYTLGSKGDLYYDGYDDVILAHTAIGIYADKASSNDFTQGISYDSVVTKGGYLNKVQCLIALECGKYNMYPDGDLSRQDLIDFTMSLAQQDGSFRYKGMATETPVKVTATAVTALALTGETGENGEITSAIEKGIDYLVGHIREDDSLDDITSTIIALNTTGRTADDVNGEDLTKWLIKYQRKDGSCSFDTTAKKGNKQDTATVLLGLASQYRYNAGMTSVYDMSDVLGGTHNKLSPAWQMNVKLMLGFTYLMIAFLLGLFIVSRYRIWKWKKEGIWDYEKGRMMSDEDIAKVKRAKEAAAKSERGESAENTQSHEASEEKTEDITEEKSEEDTEVKSEENTEK